ncbi:MAG: Gfo/Idh/MocA family oxidoreductase [Bryobacteraceae bacterium]
MTEARERSLRAVSVGAGYFSRFQQEAWTRIPEVEMAAICDLEDVKARAVQEQFGIANRYTNWTDMLDREKPDFIDIITPPPTHEEMCAEAARRGIHVICQKPLAPTLEEATRIVEIAHTAGVRLMVHENFRWQPWYRKIKELQTAGTIGEFTHIHILTRLGDGWGDSAYLDRQPFFRDYPRLLIYETGVHFIDTFRFLLGEVTEVYARLRRLNSVIRGEDTGQLLLCFESGATALWDANRYNETEAANPRYTFGEIRVDGTGGHLTVDMEGNIRVKKLGEPGWNLQYLHENRNFSGDCVYALQRHFVDCMLSGREFESSGRDYLKTLKVAFSAYASAASRNHS